METVISRSSHLSDQVQKGEVVKLSFYYNSSRINKFVNSIFSKILSHSDLNYLQGIIETILREMIVNAVKANYKRVFFKKSNLDINNSAHYDQGMEHFKSHMTGSDANIYDDLKSSGLKVELFVKKNSNELQIIVRNNSSLLPYEEERIRMRIDRACEYNDFSEIYMDISDDQEGEGLGIPLTILFLRNSGIGTDSFSIQSKGSYTDSVLNIPLKLQSQEITTSIQEQIIMDVDDLPALPDHIAELQTLCRKKDVSIKELASGVAADPSLAALVLRLANSAGFVTLRRIDSLDDGIKVIGLRNLHSILVASAARSIMDDRFSSFKSVWNHCNKTAAYARAIAFEINIKKELEKVFLAGLLHDLGKIVLLSANSELTEHIEEVSVKREMKTSTVLEEVSIGISHSSIGRMIAEKWNFPEYLVETISLHHSPLESSDEVRDIVFVTYLANVLCLIEENKFDYFYIEDEVLKRMGISDQKAFVKFHDKIRNSFHSSEKSVL